MLWKFFERRTPVGFSKDTYTLLLAQEYLFHLFLQLKKYIFFLFPPKNNRGRWATGNLIILYLFLPRSEHH